MVGHFIRRCPHVVGPVRTQAKHFMLSYVLAEWSPNNEVCEWGTTSLDDLVEGF